MARPFDTEIKSIPTSSSASVAAPSEFGRVHKTMTTAYSRERKLLVLVSLLFSWMLANADRIAMTIAIIPITQEFRLDAQSAGYVLSAFYVSYALMQLGGGWLSDRFGSRGVLVGCVAAWSVFTGMTGLAGSLGVLLVVRFLFGIGEGAFNPASSVAISEVFPKKERARAKALVTGAIFIGGALGTGSIAALIHNYGWRVAYHVLGFIGIAMALVLWFAIGKVRPRDRNSDAQREPKFRPLLRMALMQKTTLIYFFSNTVLIGLISWMPTFLVKTRHIDVVHAGFASTVPYIVAFVSLNIVGWMLDKFGYGRERLFLAVGGVWIVVFLGLMTMSASLTMVLTFWTLSMVGSTIVYGTVWAIPLTHLPDEMVGTGSGIINFGGQVAAAVAPAVIGLLVDFAHGSFTPAFLFLLGSGVALILVGLTWRSK
jgi:MFS transporter, ACS family, hexuronate transporter